MRSSVQFKPRPICHRPTSDSSGFNLNMKCVGKIDYISTVDTSQTAWGLAEDITDGKVKLKLTWDALTWLKNCFSSSTPVADP